MIDQLESLQEGLQLVLLAWGAVALAGLVLFLAPYLLLRPRDALLPPQRHRAVPWSGLEVLVVALAVVVAWPLASYSAMLRLAGEPPGEDVFLMFLANVLALPFQLATVFILLNRASGTLPYQLGVTAHRWRADAAAGYALWFALCLPVLLLHALVLWLYLALFGEEPERHKLLELIQGRRPELEWALFVAQAVVAAPLVEELMFRGVLQRWMGARSWGPHVGMMAVVALAPREADRYGVAPALFAGALAGGYLVLMRVRLPAWLFPVDHSAHLVRKPPPADPPDETPPEDRPAERERPPFDEDDLAPPGEVPRDFWREFWLDTRNLHARAVYASGALFAVGHDWPTPVALIFLGFGLGWLAYRTRSLVGPVVLHVLFNSVACLEYALTH